MDAPGRSLVLITTSGKDIEWANRLSEKLKSKQLDVVFWEFGGPLEPSSARVGPFQLMAEDATVAILFLSPEFLENAIYEFGHFLNRAIEETIRLVPVVVRECDWRSQLAIRRFQVWAEGRPLEAMAESVVERELENIATEVERIASSSPGRAAPGKDHPSIDSAPGFQYSEGVELVITNALTLAKQSRGSRVTSSCLLFGLAESGLDANDTAHFIRGEMNRSGGYNDALKDFLIEIGDSSRHATTELPVLGKVSYNVRALIESAERVATRTRPGSRVIHQRHLLAALLLIGDTTRDSRVLRRLVALGLNVKDVCKRLREHVDFDPRGEDPRAWDEILLGTIPGPEVKKGDATDTADPFVSGPAGYTSEFCGVGGTHAVADHLGVEPMAHRLAELIALKETKLPLAVGLFGNWGSGKSHFMNLMDRHIQAVSRNCPADGPWCREIVPIYFNAWHYLDANLWASLVTEIFDGLFRHLQPKQDALTLVRARLKEAGGASALAEEEVRQARDAVSSATSALVEARENSEQARAAVDGLLDNLKTLAPLATRQAARQLEQWLGVSAEVATLTQLAEKHDELSSVPRRLREIWHRVIAQPGRWWRIGWLAAILVVVPLALEIIAPYIPMLRTVLARVGPEVRWALLDLISLLVWLSPKFAALKRQITQMEALQSEAEQARKARAANPEVMAAQQGVVRAEAAAVAAETRLADARSLEQQLTLEAEALRPDRRLSRFIEARARSADYRGQLGLVSLARRDFRELSDIFADREALQAKLQALKDPKDVEDLQRLSDSIDRIVLFVDDLDRCQPEKIVDVLQAVHLLLAYPLFAVVVGVDQRALRQSLKTQFSGLLTETDERPATPLDYLEKIFHVPFHLPPMDERGFADLMESLTKPAIARVGTSASSNGGSPAPQAQNMTIPDPAAPSVSIGQGSASPSGTPAPQNASASTAASVPSPPQGIRVVGSVPLQEWERKALQAYHPLVRTPRGATRLLNTYRLLRAGIPEGDWHTFRGDGEASGEFRVAMLLLAAAAGSPAVAREWFDLLRGSEPATVFDAKKKDVDADWLPFREVYLSTVAKGKPQRSRADFEKWINHVERFAF